MHLAFIDIVSDYAADRPDGDQPLGGTTSAVCFLAREMAKSGITCTLFNKIREPRTVHGVRALPMEMLTEERLKPEYTGFIFAGRWVEWLVKAVREVTAAPLIAWMHESSFNPSLVPPLAAFNGVAYVSEWQKRVNQSHAHPHWQQVVMRNAMNPRALNLFGAMEPIRPSKIEPPVLVYAGATPRGAFHMPPVLDHLRPTLGPFSTEIYCDCTPTRDADANTRYISWMRSLPNVTHVGMVGQAELLQKMKRATLMVSPNPWPETSCIALIEAMAAGLSVITTNRGALPETAAGFARIVPLDDPDHPTRFDAGMPYDLFAATIREALDDWTHKPDETEQKMRAQVNYFTSHYQWSQRVAPWVDFIKTLTA